MNYKNKNLEELGKKIDDLDNQNKDPSIKKKESGAGFGFKVSTEIIAALVVGVGIGLIVDNYFNTDRKSTRLNSSHSQQSRMPSSA